MRKLSAFLRNITYRIFDILVFRKFFRTWNPAITTECSE